MTHLARLTLARLWFQLLHKGVRFRCKFLGADSPWEWAGQDPTAVNPSRGFESNVRRVVNRAILPSEDWSAGPEGRRREQLSDDF
jgi:hypothetical protein